MMQISLFADTARMTLAEAKDYSIEALRPYCDSYQHWAICYSGGKDSTATVAFVLDAIAKKRLPSPESITILYANTRQELPPLHDGAMAMLRYCQAFADSHGINLNCKVVEPQRDHRYLVYVLGRGVPPPSNVFRWCTEKLKLMPMKAELAELYATHGKFLSLTGVREGESAARDGRLQAAGYVSCSKDGGECGQGHFQRAASEDEADTFAPIIHWRVCHVIDWITELYAEGWPVDGVLDTYGFGEDANADGNTEQLTARTGCMKCPLVSEGGKPDKSLMRLSQTAEYAYLQPLNALDYWAMRRPEYRLRKWGQRTTKGVLESSQCRMGPLTLEARRYWFDKVLEIQAEVNDFAARMDKPAVWLLTPDDQERIQQLWAMNTWPQRWHGTPMSPIEFHCMIRGFDGQVPADFMGCEIHATTPHPKIDAKTGAFSLDLFQKEAA